MKRFVQAFVHEFVYGGHLLSLGASGIVWSVIILSDRSGGWPIILLAYLVMQIIYAYDHLNEEIDINNSNLERTKYLLKTKKIQIFLLVVYILGFLLELFFVPLSVLLWALFIILGGILYTKKLKQLTEKIVGFKNIYASLFWAFLVFLVPFYYSLSLENSIFLVLFLFVFIRFVVSTVFFDLKDVRSDRKNKLKTVPVFWGVQNTIVFLHILNIFSGVLPVLMVIYGVFPVYALAWLLVISYSAYYIFMFNRLSEKNLIKISYVLVDGEYLIWPILLFVGRIVF